MPVTAQQINRLTKADPCLSKALQYTRQGWPSRVPEELKPYKQRANEITIEGDCLLWGIRGEGDGLPLLHRLQNFLLSYRATPYATTNKSQSSLFLHRPI